MVGSNREAPVGSGDLSISPSSPGRPSIPTELDHGWLETARRDPSWAEETLYASLMFLLCEYHTCVGGKSTGKVLGAVIATLSELRECGDVAGSDGPDTIFLTKLLALLTQFSDRPTNLRLNALVDSVRRVVDEEPPDDGNTQSIVNDAPDNGNVAKLDTSQAFEKRNLSRPSTLPRTVVTGPDDVYRHLLPRFAGYMQEIFLVVALDARHGVIDIIEVARGCLTHVEVHPREVFRPLTSACPAGPGPTPMPRPVVCDPPRHSALPLFDTD